MIVDTIPKKSFKNSSAASTTIEKQVFGRNSSGVMNYRKLICFRILGLFCFQPTKEYDDVIEPLGTVGQNSLGLSG